MHINIGDAYWDKQKPDLPTYRYEKAVISQLCETIGNYLQLFGAYVKF